MKAVIDCTICKGSGAVRRGVMVKRKDGSTFEVATFGTHKASCPQCDGNGKVVAELREVEGSKQYD